MLVKGGHRYMQLTNKLQVIQGIQFDIQGLAVRLRNDLALAT